VTRLSRAGGRAVIRLLPAERREWAEAIWAEAGQAASARERFGWYSGGVRTLAGQAAMTRRAAQSLGLAVTAGVLIWSAGRGAAPGPIAAFVWLDAFVALAALTGVPWLVRRRLGPSLDSRLTAALRGGVCLAVLALILAMAARERGGYTGQQFALLNWISPKMWMLLLPWLLFLVLLVGYVAAVFAVTAQRSWVAPGTLVVGTSIGLLLGAVMYAIMPLGFGDKATAPWLPGAQIDPVVAFAWILLFGGPLAAALLAGWRHAAPGAPLPAGEARIRQAVAAGLLVALVGSLVVCVLGTVTVAMLPHAGWLGRLLYSSRHLTGTALSARISSQPGAPGAYLLVWLFFPIIGLGVASCAALAAWSQDHGQSGLPGRGSGGGGDHPGTDPVPGSPVMLAALCSESGLCSESALCSESVL
jgi:hypothetical protein